MRTLPYSAAAAASGIALLINACAASSAPDPRPEPDELASELALATCSDNPAPFDPTRPYEPDVEPDELHPRVTNPFFPLPVGARWVYRAETPDGVERGVVKVKEGAKDLWGTRARIVRDTATLDGELAEDTFDWFAEDEDGNAWYMGERTTQYEGGEPVGHEGSWKSGVGGALPGVQMLGDPQVGCRYRQEYLAGEAEDWARVVALDQTVTVAAGTFTGCIRTRERSAIDPDLDETKYFCPGIGLALVEEGEVREELISYSGL
jgi:hypothetical protein